MKYGWKNALPLLWNEILATFNNKCSSAVIQTSLSKRHTGKRGLRTLERTRGSEDPLTKEDPITEDLKKTLSLRTLERILSLKTLERTLSMRTVQETISLRSPERTLSLRPQAGPFTNTILRLSRESMA